MEIDLGASAHEGRRAECLSMARRLHDKFSAGYTHDVSAAPLVEVLMGRTAQRRARHCSRLGYTFSRFERETRAPEIFDINTSMPVRQGRPMDPAYFAPPEVSPLHYRCERHRVTAYGVFSAAGVLRAYTYLYRCGDLVLVSTILGHADALKNDVMYLLVLGAACAELPQGGVLVYNLHSSGTDGLRYFKERLGLTPTEVTWKI